MAYKYDLKVSILNGIVMEGGAGVSIHGRFRVATENSVFVSFCFEMGVFFACYSVNRFLISKLTTTLSGLFANCNSANLFVEQISLSWLSYRFLQCLKRLWDFSQILVPHIFYQDSLDSLVINWHPYSTSKITV
jgi:hypothetical protein